MQTKRLTAFIGAALIAVLLAAPASAATTGTLCGRVTAFTAPTAVADGSLTINGTVEVIDSSAFAAIGAATLATLQALATAGATTCLDVQANGSGAIVDIAIAATAQICGTVGFNSTLSAYTIDGVALPMPLVTADADLSALLGATATGDGTLCADVSVNTGTGLLTAITVNGSVNLCGTATLTADAATLEGVDVPLTLLDADAQAALAAAVDAGADVCVTATIADTTVVDAALTAHVHVCGDVALNASGDASVGGVTLDSSLLSANAAALLQLAANAGGTACADVVAAASGGGTTISVAVTVNVCATVTAVSGGTVTLGGVSIDIGSQAASEIQVGDRVCVSADAGPTGSTSPPTGTVVDAAAASSSPSGSSTGPTSVSNTAVREVEGGSVAMLGITLLALAGMLTQGLVRRRARHR